MRAPRSPADNLCHSGSQTSLDALSLRSNAHIKGPSNGGAQWHTSTDFVLAVPKKNLAAYKKLAQKAGKIWLEFGALGIQGMRR